MALIDDISIVPFSTSKAFTSVQLSTKQAAATIEMIKNTLVSCGWQLTTTIQPVITIAYPFGFLNNIHGTGDCGCGDVIVVVNTSTRSWVFSSYLIGQTPTPAGGGCFMFELGTTSDGSIDNLAFVMNNTPGFPYAATVLPSPNLRLVLTSNIPGPYSNFDTVDTDGRFGISSGTVAGGGYLLTSLGTSLYSVKLYGVYPQNIGFDFTLGPSMDTGIVSYEINASTDQYFMVANPYSFALWDGNTPYNSIAAFAPYIPANFEAAYCVFVVGPNNLTYKLLWGGGTGGEPCSVSLDAPPITFSDTYRGPQVLALRVGSLEGVTLNGQPVLTAAYAMMANTYTANPGVVGKLWDCQVITETLELGGSFQTGGRNYIAIAVQDISIGTACSLVFCVDDNGQTSP